MKNSAALSTTTLSPATRVARTWVIAVAMLGTLFATIDNAQARSQCPTGEVIRSIKSGDTPKVRVMVINTTGNTLSTKLVEDKKNDDSYDAVTLLNESVGANQKLESNSHYESGKHVFTLQLGQRTGQAAASCQFMVSFRDQRAILSPVAEGDSFCPSGTVTELCPACKIACERTYLSDKARWKVYFTIEQDMSQLQR